MEDTKRTWSTKSIKLVSRELIEPGVTSMRSVAYIMVYTKSFTYVLYLYLGVLLRLLIGWVIVSMFFLFSFWFILLLYIPSTAPLPSSCPSPSLHFPSPQEIQSSSISFLQRADLQAISTRHGITRRTETRYTPHVKTGWDNQVRVKETQHQEGVETDILPLLGIPQAPCYTRIKYSVYLAPYRVDHCA